jgi:hypothetical protein
MDFACQQPGTREAGPGVPHPMDLATALDASATEGADGNADGLGLAPAKSSPRVATGRARNAGSRTHGWDFLLEVKTSPPRSRS